MVTKLAITSYKSKCETNLYFVLNFCFVKRYFENLHEWSAVDCKLYRKTVKPFLYDKTWG